MVELSVIRDLVAIFGVIAGFSYYVMTVRMNQRVMKINLTNNILQRLTTEDFLSKYIELMYMEWKDYDDFEKKYGSDTNQDNFVKRQAVWGTMDSLGRLLKEGMADEELLYGSQIVGVCPQLWHKFRDVLEMNRKLYSGANGWVGFEYLAQMTDKWNKTLNLGYDTNMGDPNYEKAKLRLESNRN